MPRSGLAMMAPLLNVLLGLWLFVSAFALPRSMGQSALTAVIGIAAAGTAIISIYSRGARYVTLGLGVFLFLASVLGGGSRASVWHNVVIAALMMMGAALGDRHHTREIREGEQHLAHA